MNVITLKLTQEQLSVIDVALSRMPYGEVVRIIEDINSQLKTQLDV